MRLQCGLFVVNEQDRAVVRTPTPSPTSGRASRTRRDAVEMELTLREGSGGESDVAGSGRVILGDQSFAVDVDGTYTFPNVSLTLINESGASSGSLNYSGEMSEDGQSVERDFEGIPMTINRE